MFNDVAREDELAKEGTRQPQGWGEQPKSRKECVNRRKKSSTGTNCAQKLPQQEWEVPAGVSGKQVPAAFAKPCRAQGRKQERRAEEQDGKEWRKQLLTIPSRTSTVRMGRVLKDPGDKGRVEALKPWQMEFSAHLFPR